MKTIIKVILLLGVIGYLTFAVVKLSRDDDKRVCQGTRINVEQVLCGDFVDSLFVADILSSTNVDLQDRLIRDIDVNGIEALIQSSPYIDTVVCYYTSEDWMCIVVTPHDPILHIIAENGENYYMDAKGNDMPTDTFPLDLCLATGNITKQYAREYLLHIAEYINTTSPWNKDIQQIHVASPKNIELIPNIEGQKIVLGEPIDIEEKLKRLSAFYAECLSKAGWNKYSVIDLNYADQVVCKKKTEGKGKK